MKIKNVFVNFYTKAKSLFLKNKKLSIVFVACFIVLVFGLFSNFMPRKKEKSQTENFENNSFFTYTNAIENKLETMLLQVNEIDFVYVLVMVDSTPKVNYLMQTETVNESSNDITKSTIEETVVLEKNGSKSSPIIVSTTVPKITGVLIVTNKISSSTKVSIINSISTVLNVDGSCISILQEK